MANITPKRNGEFLKIVFNLLEENPDGVQAKIALDHVSKSIKLTEFERGSYASDSGRPRFEKIIRFATIPTVKAGWMIKEFGTWQITEDGRKSNKAIADPESFYREAYDIYRKWKRNQEPVPEEEDEELGEISPTTSVITLDVAQENSWEQIDDFVSEMKPYEFQGVVADLLVAMGYHVDWNAPPGKDRGIDIVAFNDPLGAEKPRIVVQVKHREPKTTSKDLREFLPVIGSDYVGIFVSSSGFTRDAEDEARGKERTLITLIDLKKFVSLWIKHYDNLSQEARKKLPLKAVHYLDLE